jgi:hypothetical protein
MAHRLVTGTLPRLRHPLRSRSTDRRLCILISPRSCSGTLSKCLVILKPTWNGVSPSLPASVSKNSLSKSKRDQHLSLLRPKAQQKGKRRRRSGYQTLLSFRLDGTASQSHTGFTSFTGSESSIGARSAQIMGIWEGGFWIHLSVDCSGYSTREQEKL